MSGKHRSKPVNPLIAGAFHRTGAVEVWGRGTNRVIAACKRHGTAPPIFEEHQGFVVVTLKAEMVVVAKLRPELQPESLEQRVLALVATQSLGKAEISTLLGQKTVSGQLNKVIRKLISNGFIEYTLPGTPASRLQKYRTTEKGREALRKRGGQ